MKTASPFLELEDPFRVRVTFDGVALDLPEGANLAEWVLEWPFLHDGRVL